MWMRRMLVIPLIAAALGPAARASAQATAPALPEYTTDQRWGRLATLDLSSLASEVALGKAKGMTIDEIGLWLGEYFARSWAGGLDARQLVTAFRLNALSHPAAQVEMVTFTDSLVVARFNTPVLATFGADRIYNALTLDEYRTINTHINREIADHVGVALEQRYDGDWLMMTMRNKYQAPRASTELRWNRAAFINKAVQLDVIRFAKASGKTARDAGAESVKIWASTWTTTDTPWRLFRGMMWNAMIDPNYVCDVQSASATMVRAKCNRPWLATVRDNVQRTGVSVEDYDAYTLALEQGVAMTLGMTWEVQMDGDDRVITVRRR